jgi:hypothetical protein
VGLRSRGIKGTFGAMISGTCLESQLGRGRGRMMALQGHPRQKACRPSLKNKAEKGYSALSGTTKRRG